MSAVADRVADSVADRNAENSSYINSVADVADFRRNILNAAGGDGAPLLEDLVAAIRRHVILTPAEATMCALWVLHAHTIDAHQHSPRLAITSPIPNCGKTTLCSVIGQLLGVPVVSNSTIAAFFRTVAKQGAHTIILDEADTFLGADNRDGIGILNSGHARAGAHVRRTEHMADGGLEPRDFSTWAPVVFGLIGKLPAPSLESRSLSVLLKRKRPDERVERLRQADPTLARLRERVARWAAEALPALREADPEVPPCLYNRDQDNWRPLLAVADAAGGDWPQTARRVAEALSGASEDPSECVMLLADIRRVFADRGTDRLDTKSLIEALYLDESRPWHDWHGTGNRITSRQLGGLLRLFGIRSDTVRIGAATPKGYKLEAFTDAFARHLPGLPAPASPFPKQSATSATSADFNGLWADPSATSAATAAATGADPQQLEVCAA